jgi:hypothetical protein
MARDVEELVVWQLATELKRAVYALIRTGLSLAIGSAQIT